MVELHVRRNAVVISDAAALNGGVVVVPKDVFSAGCLVAVLDDARAAVVWRRMLGMSDVTLLEFDRASAERVQEVAPKLAALLADKGLLAGDAGGRSGGTGGWKMAAVASWMVIAALGGVLGGAAAMGGEQSWSKLGALAAAKVWPSTCPTPGEGVGNAAAAALNGGSGLERPAAVAQQPLSEDAPLPGAAAGRVAATGRWAGGVGVAGQDDFNRRVGDAERAVQAEAQRLSREQAERASAEGDGTAGGSGATPGVGGPTVKAGVFVPLAE